MVSSSAEDPVGPLSLQPAEVTATSEPTVNPLNPKNAERINRRRLIQSLHPFEKPGNGLPEQNHFL